MWGQGLCPTAELSLGAYLPQIRDHGNTEPRRQRSGYLTIAAQRPRPPVAAAPQPLECIIIETMQRFERITSNPAKMNGRPCFRGVRLTVRRVVEAVALYPNRDDLFRNFPEDLPQALAFAAANLEDSAVETDAA